MCVFLIKITAPHVYGFQLKKHFTSNTMFPNDKTRYAHLARALRCHRNVSKVSFVLNTIRVINMLPVYLY